jgi:hypothetical protein
MLRRIKNILGAHFRGFLVVDRDSLSSGDDFIRPPISG